MFLGSSHILIFFLPATNSWGLCIYIYFVMYIILHAYIFYIVWVWPVPCWPWELGLVPVVLVGPGGLAGSLLGPGGWSLWVPVVPWSLGSDDDLRSLPDLLLPGI